MKTIALFGAAGKIGTRLVERFQGANELALLVVESDDRRVDLQARGLESTDAAEAVSVADVVVLAVPDRTIGPVAEQIVPLMRPGTMVIVLDPAAPFANRLPMRSDIAYFACHPAHPPIFPEDFSREAIEDHFGAGHARQSIVCALIQGDEDDYETGESLAELMWGPVLRSHRVTLEQMAILEPALSESVIGTCLATIRDAVQHAVSLGVPEAAARDFALGHLRVELAVLFEIVPFTMSDAAWQAIEEARGILLQPDWRRIFDADELRASVERLTMPEHSSSAA
jgi:D-apionate oxidoisomerase